VNDGFEPLLGGRVAEGKLAHPVTVHGTFCRDDLRTELACQLTYCSPAGCRQLSGNRIGIDQGSATSHQNTRYRGFSTAYAACQANAQEGPVHPFINQRIEE